MDSAPIFTLAPVIVYAQVDLPDGNAVSVDPQRNGVVLETFDPQSPAITLATRVLSYEQYAQLRAANPHIDYPEFTQPEPGDHTTVNTGVEVKQAHSHPNRYAQPGPVGNTIGLIVPKTDVAAPGAPSNPSGGAETEAESSWWGAVQGWWASQGSGVVHGVLDVAGLVPGIGEVFDLANAALYTAEGDYVNASLSAAAAIPFVGMAATAGKAVKTANNVVGTAKTTAKGTSAGAKAGHQGAKTTATGNNTAQQTGGVLHTNAGGHNNHGAHIKRKSNSKKQVEQEKRLQEMEGEATLTRQTIKFKNYEKEGSVQDAIKDFHSLSPKNIKIIQKDGQTGFVGELENGGRVVARPWSSHNKPTLQYNPSPNSGKRVIKIRYVSDLNP